MSDDPKTDADAAVRFLEWKRPGGPWPITAIVPDGHTTPTTWLENADEVRDFVAKESGRANLHYTVAELRRGVARKPKKTDLTETDFLHADLDPPKTLPPGEIDAWIETEVARVGKLVSVPPPSLIACSGNGLHLLWRLDEALFIGGAEERFIDVEARNRWLCHELSGDGSTWNCDRLLKLYGSINLPDDKKRKAGRTARATRIIDMNDRVHSLADFGVVDVKRTRPVGASPAGPRGDVRRMAHPDELAQWGIGEADRLRMLIVQGCDPDNFDGDRSNVVFDLCCNLHRRGIPADLIAGIISDETWPISAHVIDKGGRDIFDYAWRQVDRATATVAADGNPFETDKHGIPFPSQRNIRLALTKMGVRVRHDRFADRAALSGLEGFGPHLNDAALTRLRLRAEEEYKLKVPKEFFCDVVEDSARRDHFHPVVDYLAGVVWDGTPRLDGWMTTYLQAADTEYTRHVGIIMLVAAVRRVRQPGCKFDEMVVLESEQGKAKSSALSILAVQEDWFSDDLPLNAEAKLVIERTQGRWIIEAGELKGMTPKGVEHLKGFLSRQRDSSRMAYGRLTHDAPRHFIVVGTTNDDKYLVDNTGNRRFWPVRVGDIDLEALARDRDQLWAEAATRESSGESIRLDRALWQAAALEQDERRTIDPFVAPLADLFCSLQGKVRSSDVWNFIGTPIGMRTTEQERRLGVAMRDLGFERVQLRFGGDPEYCYRRGDEDQRKRRIHVEALLDDHGKILSWEAFLERDDPPSRQAVMDLGPDGTDDPY